MANRRLALFEQALFGASDASVDVRSLAALCFHGVPEVNGLRALCWQVLLGYLPPDRRAWAQVLRSSRGSYAQLVGKIADCLGETDDSASAQSQLDQIRADIQRTMPDIAALRNHIGSPNDHKAPNNEANRNDDEDDNYDDDDARCNTIVSDLTALSMESADTYATITPTVPRRQHSSAALSYPSHETGCAAHTEENGKPRQCSEVNRLRRSLSDKIAAATAQDRMEVAESQCIASTGAQAKSKLGSWLLSRPQTHAEALARILFVHAQFNKGVGYVQGMNELLAPLYYVLLSGRTGKGTTAQDGECEADAFHLFILAMRGEHLDMFISALDTTTAASANWQAANPYPPPPQQQQQNIGSITEQELLVHHQHALAAAMAHRSARTSAFALPVTAYNERNKPTPRNSLARNSAAGSSGGGGEIGGLQSFIRHWWENYVRTADSQLWSRLVSLGVHPEHFAVRWLLVWGAREFPLPDVLTLWDTLMANRARLAAHKDAAQEQTHGAGARSVVCDGITSAIISPTVHIARRGDHKERRGAYATVHATIGKLQCEVRLCRGMSGDDGDGSQLGFLFDFFTAVLVAMRGWLLVSPFEKCISLLQSLPHDVPELEMHSLLESALQLRSDRADRRAVKACKAILSTVDRDKLRFAVGMDASRGLEAMYALYGPSVISRRVSQDASMNSKSGGGAGSGKLSRFFGQLSGRIGQTMQTLLSADSDDDDSDMDGRSNGGTGFGRAYSIGTTARPSTSMGVGCLLLVLPVPGSQTRVAVYEVAHFDKRTLTATVVSLGECDGLRPSLASVRASYLDGKAASAVSVRLPAPYAAGAPTRAAARHAPNKGVRDGAHSLVFSTPNLRDAPYGILTATAADPLEEPWWRDTPAKHELQPGPVQVELCDYDSDGDSDAIY
ncbi:hypothetical protein GGI23_000775 [Coemansia sp. RSA 2559]|nr:hypothetical protein GGI23_000775 [Coemansia sp. RSA 2559]KAJ2868790.1 hypothetical protein GGI22_000644 [Coemansia erecta]